MQFDGRCGPERNFRVSVSPFLPLHIVLISRLACFRISVSSDWIAQEITSTLYRRVLYHPTLRLCHGSRAILRDLKRFPPYRVAAITFASVFNQKTQLADD